MDIEIAKQTSIFPDVFPWIINFLESIIKLLPSTLSIFRDIFGFVIGLSFPLSLFFLIGIIYCVEKIKILNKKSEEIYDLKVDSGFEAVQSGDAVMANRWKNTINHINSDNSNDWKQAIMEADIMLGDLLDKMGYRGETIGEKLKRVAKGDMASLNDAWEAHKIRNQIAHEGSNFSLNHHEAKNVISMYRKVFEEFYYI